METIAQTLTELIAPIKLVPVKGRSLGLEMINLFQTSYDFYRGILTDQEKELAIVVVKRPMRVDMLAKHYFKFQGQIENPVLMIFRELKARERNRLIQRKVQFLVIGKYFHAPMLGFAGETPVFEGRWSTSIAGAKLSAWAETILIKRLLDDSVDLARGRDLAKFFGVTTMTISRALRELEEFDLCFLERRGTEKRVRFEEKKGLWFKAQKILTSPVLAIVELAKLPIKLPSSGDQALDHYTMIAQVPPKSYAIYKREFLKLKKAGKIELPKLGEEKLRLQIWKRDPRALAQGDFIDPISLYLSEKDSSDDRVQVEIHKMMQELGLKVTTDG